MIVAEKIGNLFTCGIQTIACPTNASGAMGKGLALEFREKIPGLYEFYRQRFPLRYVSARGDRDNRLEVFAFSPDQQVLLFPTKDHWKNPSTTHQIEANLKILAIRYKELGIRELALPALGCGYGGLNYNRDVKALIHRHMGPLPIPVSVFFYG